MSELVRCPFNSGITLLTTAVVGRDQEGTSAEGVTEDAPVGLSDVEFKHKKNEVRRQGENAPDPSLLEMVKACLVLPR